MGMEMRGSSNALRYGKQVIAADAVGTSQTAKAEVLTIQKDKALNLN